MQVENKQTVNSAPLSSRLQYACQTNGNVRVLAIRDPLAAKSACSMCINVGSYYEPIQIPGLAHLLEHMLLMGSSSYPQSNSFSTFISSHHSYQNAETNDFSTTYFFEVPNNHFEQAVSRACDALINPIFPEQQIQAEIEAVNEEYILAGDEDQSRIQQIIRGFRHQNFGRFVMGRKQELGVKGIRDQLIKFHSNFYLKAEVCFVVYSSISMQELQKNIISQILKIGNRQKQSVSNLKIQEILKLRAYDSQNAPKLVTIKSLNNEDTLTLHIPIQLTKSPHFSPLSSRSEINELNYQLFETLKYIICHSSDYSLLSFLQDNDIANSVEMEIDIVVPFHTYAINIVIGLEQSVISNVVHVCDKVIQYCCDFVNLDVLLAAHCEVSQLAMLQFVNNQVQDLEDFICELSNDILQFGIPSAISYKNMQNNRILQFKELCTWCIQQLTKGPNRIVVLSTPDNLKGQTKLEPYFNIPFIVSDLPLKPLSSKNNPVKSLPKNPFLPFPNRINPFPKIESSQKITKLSQSIHYSQIQSQIEKGGIKILFHNIESHTFNTLFVQFMDLLVQQVENIGYAESIGLNTFFQFRNGWLYFQIYGYLHLVMIIIDQVGEKLGWLIKEIQSGSAKESEEIEDMFITAIQNVEEQIDNYYEEQMDDLTDKILDQLLIKDSLPLHLMDKQLQKIKKNKFLQRCANLLKTSLLQWIVVGNFPQQQILKISAKFQNKISNFASINFQYKQTKVMNLAPQKKSIKLQVRLQSPSVRTSTCLAYFQGGCYNRKMYWILQIISLFLEEPFYRYVRLMKKLSYDLEVNLVNTRGVLGICFLLVSSKIDPELISKQIHSFLSTHLQPTRLSLQLSSNLDKLKQSIIINSSAEFATIEQNFDFISDQIQTRSFYWHKKQKQQVQTQLSRIRVEDVIQITNRIFKNSLQILIVSQGHKQQYGDHRPKIGSIEKIKQKGEYYKDLINDVNFRFASSM